MSNRKNIVSVPAAEQTNPTTEETPKEKIRTPEQMEYAKAKTDKQDLFNAYQEKDRVDEVKTSIQQVADRIKDISNEDAIFAYDFKKLKLHEEPAYGGFKTLIDYARVECGISKDKEKKFTSDLGYRAGLGAILRGKVNLNVAPRTSQTATEKLNKYIQKNIEGLTIAQIGDAIAILLKSALFDHDADLNSMCAGLVDRVTAEVDATETSETSHVQAVNE